MARYLSREQSEACKHDRGLVALLIVSKQRFSADRLHDPTVDIKVE